MSHVKPQSLERIAELRLDPTIGQYGPAARDAEEKERMLAAIEEVRWEIPVEEYTKAMHTVLDVLEYLVRKA